MIIFIFGTTAEAIKVAPIARRLQERHIPYQLWLTMQHTTALRNILPELGLRMPDRLIADGRNGQPLRGFADVAHWLWQILRWLRRNGRGLRQSLPSNTVIVVHGDTLTSVVGALIARRLKVQCAHVEAGLRSGNWRHPFPEELDRRIVGALASIHYTPSEEATNNLAAKRNVVHTEGNTVIDAVLDQGDDAGSNGEKFGVVLLHRFEFISNQPLVEETVSILAATSPYPLKLIVDAYSEHAVKEAALSHGKGRLTPQPKLSHQEFVGLMKGAEFIVTDSGGIQAETALLGVPTLIHRKTTEQGEGLGANIVLSEWKSERLSAFLKNFGSYRRPIQRPEHSPSDIVVNDLVARGFATSDAPRQSSPF
ncbi:UDP-N-acetylglucosamine 2-epimerase [Glaciibacter sp. 2TAF33]|uniref:UDP-N-acetylglucosamine 2-epimerase n=1 Tax=Glaciibacter sp. 2TAF33 TaxID=3233015 RepID=UPI003F9295C3